MSFIRDTAEPIKIAVEQGNTGGDDYDVDGQYVPRTRKLLATTRIGTSGYYTVTHVPTGARFPGSWKNRRKCAKAAQRVWDAATEEQRKLYAGTDGNAIVESYGRNGSRIIRDLLQVGPMGICK